jgi:hypothetical protein
LADGTLSLKKIARIYTVPMSASIGGAFNDPNMLHMVVTGLPCFGDKPLRISVEIAFSSWRPAVV